VGVLQKSLKSANFRPCALKLNITVRLPDREVSDMLLQNPCKPRRNENT